MSSNTQGECATTRKKNSKNSCSPYVKAERTTCIGLGRWLKWGDVFHSKFQLHAELYKL